VVTVVAAVGPYSWEPHLLTWAVLILVVGSVVLGHRRLVTSSERPIPWSRRQVIQFAGAAVAAAVALTWPLADLAAHWSLLTLVVQRLILLLVVAPLVVLGLPYDVVQWATRPVAVDSLLIRLQRPLVAIATVTVLVVGSMTPFVVRAQSTSFVARGAVSALILFAGLVLWMPVLGRIPGIARPKPVIRFAYLVAQAVVPAFLSFIYIFSIHPLYHEFARSRQAIGLRPLNDQQIAGFASKLSMLLVLLSVGAAVLARASTTEEDFGEDDPLLWADVERQFERVDRKGTRRGADLDQTPGGESPTAPSRTSDLSPDPADRSRPTGDPNEPERPPDDG
jgi:cytochrome c oxidase assembly factor CtaG